MVSFIKKYATRINGSKVFQSIKPGLTVLAFFLILRFTGALSGFSMMANRALIYTGIMNASTDELDAAIRFDYHFNLKDLDGKIVDVESFKGKTIFLNIWATWCGPCRAEMASIQQLYQKVDKEKVVFIMLDSDRESDQKVKYFITDKAFTFPVYRPHGALPELLEVPTIPTTFVVNPQGKVVYKTTGVANYDTSKFLEFLEKQSASPQKMPNIVPDDE